MDGDSGAIELEVVSKVSQRLASSAHNELPSGLTASIPVETASIREVIDLAEANGVSSVQYRRKSLLHFLPLCWCLGVNGWHDATTGPMLPRIQATYHVRTSSNKHPYTCVANILDNCCVQIGFAIVSLLFVSNAVVSTHDPREDNHLNTAVPGFPVWCDDKCLSHGPVWIREGKFSTFI